MLSSAEQHVHRGLITADKVTPELVDELAEQREEPRWLRDERMAAADLYQHLPVPRWQRGIRGWWTTDPSSLHLERIIAVGLTAARRGSGNASSERGGLLTVRDGVVAVQQLDRQLGEQGVIFTDLSSAARDHEGILRAHLGKLLRGDEDKFVALNRAMWTGGVLIYVPPGVEVALPLQAHFELASPGGALFGRTLLVAERGSRVTYVEDYRSAIGANQGLHSGVVEVIAKPDAEVTFVSIHNWGDGIFNFAQQRAEVQRDARAHWVTGFVGSGLTKAVLESRLSEPGASVDISGIFFGSKEQHLDLISRTFHQASHGSGDVLFKGIVRDSARAGLEGLIRVEKGAQQTTSYLSHHALQLSKEAKSNAVPSLEIEANDVRVSHGATVGMIDEEQLYYLMTRGLDRRTAERTIVRGFFEPVLARIPVASARRDLQELLDQKMAGG